LHESGQGYLNLDYRTAALSSSGFTDITTHATPLGVMQNLSRRPSVQLWIFAKLGNICVIGWREDRYMI
jgi:hypothetical protein